MYKTCTYCKQTKPIESFPKHYCTKDKLDSRCRVCKTQQNTLTRNLRKTAPQIPPVCECCKKPTDKWRLDHDHQTGKFRGWLCDSCNLGIGKLGDNLSGLMLAVEYLSRNDRG